MSLYGLYHRTLAYVYFEDGIFLNSHVVKKDNQWVMTVPPKVRHADEFLQFAEGGDRKLKEVWVLCGR